MQSVLLIEDDEIIQARIEKSLSTICDLSIKSSVAEAEQVIYSGQFDLFIIDIELPDGDGFRLCSEIRSQTKFRFTPVLILTSHASINDKLFAFNLGCDDYITKPFDMRELVARVRRHLEVRSHRESKDTQSGGILVKPESQEVFVVNGSEDFDQVSLTQTEYKILAFLLDQGEKIVPLQDLKAAVWGRRCHVEDNSLYSHVSRLRRKLGAEGDRIQSRNGGYLLQESKLRPSA